MGRCFLCDQPSKYRCPACETMSCSLGCVRQHKILKNCSGQVDVTRIIPRAELLTTRTLDRDYNYLQHIAREVELATPEPAPRHRDFVKNGVLVRTMPRQMTRALRNKSGWKSDLRCFIWTVEIQLDGKESKTVDVPDSTTIGSLGQRLALCDASGKLHPLDPAQTLHEALRGQTVLEYPKFVQTDDHHVVDTRSPKSPCSGLDLGSGLGSDSGPEEESSKLSEATL